MSTTWDPLAALSGTQREQLGAFERQLLRFNSTHNLISRRDEAHVWERHILHALALTWKSFAPGSTVVDWGSGGGLPAIPLAIAFPEVQFVTVDAARKKTMSVRAMARRLGLDNLAVWHGRAEHWPGTTHYSVSRATAPLVDLWHWHRRSADSYEFVAGEETWSPGLFALKGGDLTEEVEALQTADPSVQILRHPLQPLLNRDYYAGKAIVVVRGRERQVEETRGE